MANATIRLEEDSSIEWLWNTNVWIALETSGAIAVDYSGAWSGIGESVVVPYEPLADYVAFDVGGIRDWLVPGETGLFAATESGETRVAAARCSDALSRALDKIADPAELSRMGANALAKAGELFDPDRFTRSLLSF